ncbi:MULTISPECIES: hypothetical protein [unclassified Micromonospora]|uniref:hypothetical protein n=1 Tax=unclassified Micromonospora TaxID=2617518 RepID=UPI00332A2BF3
MTLTIASAAPVFHGTEMVGDMRFYLIDDLRLISVTTATGVIGSEALLRWAAQVAADAAFAELPTVVIASRIKPCGNTWSKCAGDGGHSREERCDRCPCVECRECVAHWLAGRHLAESARRADEGKAVHDVVEWWSYHGEIKPYDGEITPYVKAFEQFVADYGLTPESFLVSEALVVNRDAGYAGTTDGIVVIDASRTDLAAKLVSRLTGVNWKKAKRLGLTVTLIIDFKTREGEKPKFYPEQALQVTGYRHAPVIRVKNSEYEEPMPATDGGMLVQLRPDGYTPRLVLTTEETYRDGFLHALGLAKWLIEVGPAAVSSRTFVLPETTAARKRKADREAAAAPAAA